MDAGRKQLVAAAVAELKKHAPFDAMDGGSLRFLARRLAVGYYPRGATIVGAGPADRLHIVKSGRVRGRSVSFGTGECFPVGALVARHPPADPYYAEQDSFCWELPAAAFYSLLERSSHFHAFCTDRLALLLERSQRALHAEAGQSLVDGAGLLAPLHTVVTREAISCGPQTPVGDAIRTMHASRVGSMVVIDASRAPVGIFTTHDVLERVASPQAAMDLPIGSLMTPRPLTLEHQAPVIEAALAMVRNAIRHVIVTRDGVLLGVVSERDLFSLQRMSLRRIAERVHSAREVAQLVDAAAEIRQLTRQLRAQGVAAEQLTQVISALNDSLSRKVISLAEQGRDLPGRWCWLSLGSEGRLEQTFASDQDNALIFEAERRTRGAFLDFADTVNRNLDAVGFPLCSGDIMARNPRWCLDAEEWRARFGGWIETPDPQALLHATIFFDFRPLAGDARLAGELRTAVLAQARGGSAFCRAMAHNALQTRPPLGVLRDFTAEDGVLDLKGHGARLFVDAARVLVLARGIAETGTAARLRAVEEAAAVEAFHCIQGLRLKEQGNRLTVEGLSAIDRRMLKEAFRQAVTLQDRLRLDFP